MQRRTPMTFKLDHRVAQCLRRLARLPQYQTMTNVVSALVLRENEAQFNHNRRVENETTDLRPASAGNHAVHQQPA
jgi:hypothetical protein